MEWINDIRFNQYIEFRAEDRWDVIYAQCLAESMYRDKSATAKQLSIWKQQNIRMAIQEGFAYQPVKDAMTTGCGYCFRYRFKRKDRNRTADIQTCETCPLKKKYSKPCYDIKEYIEIKQLEHKKAVIERGKDYRAKETINVIKEFSKLHKQWCMKLGLWQQDWI